MEYFEVPLKKFLDDNKGKNSVSYKTPEFTINLAQRHAANFINRDEKLISPIIVNILELTVSTDLDLSKVELIIDFFENYCKENNKVLIFLTLTKDDIIDILIKRDYNFTVGFKEKTDTWDITMKNKYSSDEFKNLEYKKHKLLNSFKLGNIKIITEDKKEKIYTDEEALIEFNEDFKINLDKMISYIETNKYKKYEKFYNNYGKFKINLEIYSNYTESNVFLETVDVYEKHLISFNPSSVRFIQINDFFSVSHYVEIYQYILQTIQKLCEDKNIVIISYVNKQITDILVKQKYSFQNNKKIYTSDEFEELSETEKNNFYSNYSNRAFNLLNIIITKQKQIEKIQEIKHKKYQKLGLNTQNYYNSEVNAFNLYSGNLYGPFNITFKTTGYPNQLNYELYLNLWNMIDRNPLLEDIVVYRGVPVFNKTWYTNEWIRENNTIYEIEESEANLRCFPSYFSASTSKDIAQKFALANQHKGFNGCIMIIHLKKGDRAFHMAEYSKIESEKEVLVAPGQLKIIKVPQKDSNGMITVECEYSNISDICFNSIGINKLKPLIDERENHVCSFKNNECDNKLLFCTETEKYFCESHHKKNCIDIFNYNEFEHFIKSEKYNKMEHITYNIERLIRNIGELNDEPLIINLKGVVTKIQKLPFNDSILKIPEVVDFKTLTAKKKEVPNSTSESYIYTDKNNKEYVVKLAVGRNSAKTPQPFRAVSQEIFSQVSSVVRPRKYVPVVQIEGGVNGVPATVQPWIEHSIILGQNFNPSELSFNQKKDIAEEHMLDWLLSQHDTHGDNLLIRPDGHIVSIDKEQGFKYFLGDFEKEPQDTKLSVFYNPTNPYNPNNTYYNKFWKAFSNKKLEFDPTVIKPVLERIENIPKSDYIKVLHKFAISKYTDKNTIRKFIDLGLKRKNDIRADFEEFISNLYSIQTGKKGTFRFSKGWKVNISSKFGMKSKKWSIRKSRRKSSRRKSIRNKSSIRKKSKKSNRIKKYIKKVSIIRKSRIRKSNR